MGEDLRQAAEKAPALFVFHCGSLPKNVAGVSGFAGVRVAWVFIFVNMFLSFTDKFLGDLAWGGDIS